MLVASLGLSRCAAADDVQFTRDVLPILASNCFACHGFDEGTREAGLRLDTFDGATAELDSGARAIVPGNAAESELLRRVETGDASELMPPADSGKELTPQQKRTLRQWVEQGAEYRPHWSFVAPRQVPPPEVPGVEHPIDRFIQSRLADPQLKLRPSAEASRETLIRRVSLDLTGLPPTPREVDEFLAASAQDPEQAYRTLVGRLLSSPHYGERWARWWLDQARYADSNGYSIDAPRQIWKYRDWVVSALNADLPFDRFTVEQLAGDLLPDATDSQRVATGFHRNTQINQEGGIDKEQFRVDSVFDRVATTGTVWLGLTIGCAQCHNHKFDPIEQKDYYRLFAFLNNQDEPTMRVYEPDVDVSQLMSDWREAQSDLKERLEEHAKDLAAWEASLDQAARKQLDGGVQKILAVAAGKRSLDQRRALYRAARGSEDPTFHEVDQRYADLERRVNGATTTMVLQELAKPRKTTVFIKGDFTRPADEVTPGTPAVLHPFENTTGKANRLDLARWITSPRNPLTARVVVNRIWQQYFGRGIVETENDFGLQGTPPTHPELLDWLAVEWMARGWSLKELHRLLVTSHTYRQSSSDRPDIREKDPNNYFLARQQRLRLEAEIIRDVALTASGLLAPKLGGPPVFPPIPDGVMGQGQVKREWTVSQGPDRYRRGLYTFVYRATPPPALNVFDAPDGYSTCTRRIRSNTPLQALTLLNDAAYF
ncbi:MAG: PSD1 and planctomycete cytochrome C domain-containing protein, partial [Pirellulaceae bacterium]